MSFPEEFAKTVSVGKPYEYRGRGRTGYSEEQREEGRRILVYNETSSYGEAVHGEICDRKDDLK